MGSTVIFPPELLRRDIDCFILNEFTAEDGATIHTFPNGKPGIVFHHHEGRPVIENITTLSGRTISPPSLFLYGIGPEPSVMNFGKGAYTVIQVIFKPHALKSLLDLNALTLNQGAIDLDEFSTEDLNQQLMEAPTSRERVNVLTRFLLGQLQQERRRDALVEESLWLIHQRAGAITVDTLLRHLGLSERQFERRFSQTVGISPISYIRIKRFNEALRLMRSRQYDTLTEVAHALHFHDQSHFIRDIKAFTGITPKGLSQKVDDFYHDQAGYSST